MWMLVTDDGLELPVAVAASLSDISKSTGISLPCLSNMRQGRRHWSYLNRQKVKLVEVQTEMGKPLAELQLRMLPYNALRRNGIETIEQVLEMSTEQLMGLHGVGINIVAEVKAAAERWRDARGEACTHCNRAGSCPWESYEDCGAPARCTRERDRTVCTADGAQRRN